MAFTLTPGRSSSFGLYYAALAEWNQRANLTAIVDEVGVQRRHFLDSLTVSHTIPAMVLETGGRLMDVGAGAGFPGLPLKIAYPQLDVYLLDATAKKTAFLSHVGKALGLDGVTVLTGRAEELARDPALREAFDVVVSRAVSKMRVLAELTLPFARVGGLVIAQKGTGVHKRNRRSARCHRADGRRAAGDQASSRHGRSARRGRQDRPHARTLSPPDGNSVKAAPVAVDKSL